MTHYKNDLFFDLLQKGVHVNLYYFDKKTKKTTKTKKINENNFYKNKKLFNLYDLDVNKILVSKKELYGTKNSLKYFIGYYDDDVVRP